MKPMGWNRAKEQPLAPAAVTGEMEPLSYQELHIAAALSGRMLQKYEFETRTLYRYYNAEALFGVPKITKDYPWCIVRCGMVAQESRQDYLSFYDTMRRGMSAGSCDVKFYFPALAQPRWFHEDYSTVYDSEGTPSHAIISLYDNTVSREKDMAYQKWQTSLTRLLSTSKIYAEFNITRDQIDRAEGMIPGSPGSRQECSLEEFIEYGIQHTVAHEDAENYSRFFNRNRLMELFKNGTVEDNLDFRSFPDTEKWCRANVQMIQYPHSEDIKAFMVFTDVTVQKDAMTKLSLQASRDSLTGLLNRLTCENRILEALKAPAYNGGTLFMADLDNFKQINDHLGHQQGDAVLTKAGTIISEVFRTDDIVGRFGGDEFLAFLPGIFDPGMVAARAGGLVERLSMWMEGPQRLHLSASVGAVIADGTLGFEELYGHADKALYEAKRQGKNQFQIVDFVHDKPGLK